MRGETIVQRWHCVVIDTRAGVGVGMASEPLCSCAECLASWWDDRDLLDAELRVLNMAVLDVLPADDQTCARFTIGRHEPAWSEDGSAILPWGPDDLPCAPGDDDALALADLTALWRALARLVEQLDSEAA